MNPAPRIAVIGAGMAGLACASALQAAGYTASVFEKSRGPSGRMSTRRDEAWQCDHGAQYFTARDPLFRAEVARWQHAGVAAIWAPRMQVLGGASDHRTDPAVERFVGTPRMSAPGRLLADALTLTTQATIQKLVRQADGWQLFSAEQGGMRERFDAAVLAVPAPQAVPLLTPLAPQLASLAASANMRGCWALMLHFMRPVGLPFDAAFVNDGPLRWIARDSSKPGRTPQAGQETWLLHASPEWSEAHLEEDGNSIAESLISAFVQLGGGAPDGWTAHRWRYADTHPVLQQRFAWDGEQRLGLCGDWLNGGKVQGAWLSGTQLAQEVVQSLSAA